MALEERIIQINIEEEMKTAYIDYSMSVIVSRALPDVRDGLKPVHRRVIYAMNELGLTHNKSYKKSARIVGECLGKYHPHGDGSVYDAMVRMAQPWSLRVPLVDGQGNFGSVDGDSPAAMRYTEARLQRVTGEMISDIDKDTVDFTLNFDDSLEEPTVLPSRIPNLLFNGASGIAVGMATNMLPHNPTEVVNGIIAYIDNNEISIDELCQFIKAPDFPTGGTIYGYEGVRRAFLTGRGRVVVRAKAEIETFGKNDRERIIVTEIPYQVNKANLIKRTAELVNEKKIEGISDIRDESDRKGMRIVYEIKRDASANVVLNQLYSFTQLQSSYGVNNVCLVKGRPYTLNLKDLIKYFVEFRHEVVVRRTEFDLKQAEKRAHILEGLLIALDHLDEIIKLIRASKTPEEAKNALIARFDFTEVQAKAILDMRLQRLTALERDKIQANYDELMKKIAHLKEILSNESMRMDIIKEELVEVGERYGQERRTDIVMADDELTIEDILENEQVVVTISHLGYVKRTNLDEYREQNRGGKGSKGGATREEDFIEHIFVGSTHDYLLIFTEQGRCHWLRVFKIPRGTKISKGRAIQNIIRLRENDKIKAYVTVKDLKDTEFLENHFVVFATKKGMIKKTALELFSRPRNGGINAITINEGDNLLEVKLTNGNCDILLGVKSGRAIRFPESKVRSMGRTAAGVRGIKLKNDSDEVVGLICVDKGEEAETMVLSISEKGYGKRTEVGEYRQTNRGGTGIKTISVTEKTGQLIAIKDVKDNNGLIIINKSGITIRLNMDGISVQGRATQGVRLINLKNDDEIASVAKITIEEEAEEAEATEATTSETETAAPNSNAIAIDLDEEDADNTGDEEE